VLCPFRFTSKGKVERVRECVKGTLCEEARRSVLFDGRLEEKSRSCTMEAVKNCRKARRNAKQNGGDQGEKSSDLGKTGDG